MNARDRWDDMAHTMVYEGADGEEVLVTVPWGYQSGRIPPPLIKFWISEGQELVFGYAGSRGPKATP